MEPMHAKGYNGTLDFDGEWLTITRSGFVARLFTDGGTQRLHISQVTAVTHKPGTRLMRGFLRFTLPGSGEPTHRIPRRVSQSQIESDPLTVTFNRGSNQQFEIVRAAVDDALVRLRKLPPA